MAIITLTTDFGTRDGYVGAMKGAIARRSAVGVATQVVDITHDVPRGDIAHAAWIMDTASREFPRGTVHVVVVDPGVGGARRSVIATGSRAWYVGPDNGVFAYVTERDTVAWAIQNARFCNRHVSPTFHGRDVFAPAAALLADGELPQNAGMQVRLTGALPWGPRPAGEGRVVHVDHFGNLVTDLPAAEAGEAISIEGTALAISRTYEDVAPGALLAYIGSAGTVEIAVRDGRADQRLRTPRGTVVQPVAGLGGPYR